MRLYGDIHEAMHGELSVLREVAALADQWCGLTVRGSYSLF